MRTIVENKNSWKLKYRLEIRTMGNQNNGPNQSIGWKLERKMKTSVGNKYNGWK